MAATDSASIASIAMAIPITIASCSSWPSLSGSRHRSPDVECHAVVIRLARAFRIHCSHRRSLINQWEIIRAHYTVGGVALRCLTTEGATSTPKVRRTARPPRQPLPRATRR